MVEEEKRKGNRKKRIIVAFKTEVVSPCEGELEENGPPRTAIAGNLTVTDGLELELRMEQHQI